jgi:hypothetical protein
MQFVVVDTSHLQIFFIPMRFRSPWRGGSKFSNAYAENVTKGMDTVCKQL